ncbi:MAG: hypothetical protein IJO26_02840 [Clostridium sp.]|nr:hypothetical protein [Clostridium sp.]
MKLLELFFLTEEEIGVLAIYLIYGIALGVLIGIFISKIELCFALGGVVSIIISLFRIYINRINLNKL